MYSFISILIVIVCLLLVLIVLVQNSKGGGLASNFAETGQMMGVRKTADFLEKATWTLAVALMLFCIVASAALPRGDANAVPVSRVQEQVQRAMPGEGQPVLPTQAGMDQEAEEGVPEIEDLPAPAAGDEGLQEPSLSEGESPESTDAQ